MNAVPQYPPLVGFIYLFPFLEFWCFGVPCADAAQPAGASRSTAVVRFKDSDQFATPVDRRPISAVWFDILCPWEISQNGLQAFASCETLTLAAYAYACMPHAYLAPMIEHINE